MLAGAALFRLGELSEAKKWLQRALEEQGGQDGEGALGCEPGGERSRAERMVLACEKRAGRLSMKGGAIASYKRLNP